MARGLFAGRGRVGSKFRKLREEKKGMAKLAPELAPSSPERRLVKSPIEKMVPEGSAKMVAVRPTITQIAQDVQAPIERGQVMTSVAPPGVHTGGPVHTATDKPVSREVARTAAMDVIREGVISGAAATPASPAPSYAVPATQAPTPTKAPVTGGVLGTGTQRQGITKEEAIRRQPKMRRYQEQYGKRKTGLRYIAEKGKKQIGGWGEFIGGMGGMVGKSLLGQTQAKSKSKRWWGGRFA